MKNVICKFCGSVGVETLPDSTTEEELLDFGTRNCNCREARKFQELLNKAEEAKLELTDIAKSSEDGKLKEIGGAVVDILSNAIDLMPHGEIHKIGVSTPAGAIDIMISASGKFTIKRTLSIKRKREIGS